MLIDGLDEAVDPDQLTRKLLRPLLEYADGCIRLLVGARPYLLPGLGTARTNEIDLDAARYADLEALTAYAARGLLGTVPDSIYPHQDPSTLRAVADAVAAQATPSFLVARIVAATLAAATPVPDPHYPTWRRSLPSMPGEAMRHDLDSRLGPESEKARDLLRPLAFAQVQGLPWEDLWAPLASAMAEVTYTDDDRGLESLFDRAALGGALAQDHVSAVGFGLGSLLVYGIDRRLIRGLRFAQSVRHGVDVGSTHLYPGPRSRGEFVDTDIDRCDCRIESLGPGQLLRGGDEFRQGRLRVDVGAGSREFSNRSAQTPLRVDGIRFCLFRDRACCLRVVCALVGVFLGCLCRRLEILGALFVQRQLGAGVISDRRFGATQFALEP